MIKDERLPADILQKLPRLAADIENLDFVQALYFFGSLVRGELQPLSDLDFAVLLDKELDNTELFERQLELAGYISAILSSDEFDLVVLNNCPLRFAYRILKEGKLVFVKDRGQLIDFREKVIRFNLDFSFYRSQFDKAFKAGMGLHG